MSKDLPPPSADDLHRWTTTPEGQFFERKSAVHGPSQAKRARNARDIAWDVAETLAAMANADGGELVVGLEDDGTLTGLRVPEDRMPAILTAYQSRGYVSPPLPARCRELRSEDGHHLLHFTVDWSPTVHQLADSRYLLRVSDQNAPFPAEQIAALKAAKSQGLWERSFPPGATMADLDEALLASVAPPAWGTRKPIEILQDRGLVVDRGGELVPTLAALLLFGKAPSRWHPRCGIDFVRWQGTERKHGAELNVLKRFPIEAPLAILIRKAYEAIQPQIPERQNLQDLFFTEKLQYPAFAWQEAIVNAVAHRDYGIQGGGIEVWMFDDRLEVRSPGLPPAPVTTEALSRREHLHMSRNPLLVRVLVELGFMRELGEGIPRMFDEMAQAGCRPPTLALVGGMSFQVTLRHEPVYDRATLRWLKQFDALALDMDQKRILASAHAHDDRFTSRDVQSLLETDIYGASALIKDLLRKGAARSPGKGSRIYHVQEPLQVRADMPEELARMLVVLNRRGNLRNGDLRKELQVARNTAFRLLQEWTEAGWLDVPKGKRGRGAIYTAGPKLLHQSPIAPSAPQAGAMPGETGAMPSETPPQK
jgi:ATP-dependent DNA helicase RecG